MPALQVRDMPQDLYDQLKHSAKSNHRSMAQQTMYYLEKNLTDKPEQEDVFITEDERRKQRAARAKKIFAYLDEINKDVEPVTDDEAERLWRESREELERRSAPLTEKEVWG